MPLPLNLVLPGVSYLPAAPGTEGDGRYRTFAADVPTAALNLLDSSAITRNLPGGLADGNSLVGTTNDGSGSPFTNLFTGSVNPAVGWEADPTAAGGPVEISWSEQIYSPGGTVVSAALCTATQSTTAGGAISVSAVDVSVGAPMSISAFTDLTIVISILPAGPFGAWTWTISDGVATQFGSFNPFPPGAGTARRLFIIGFRLTF